MGGGGGGDGESITRYAPYIEERHEAFLGQSQTVYGDSLRVPSASPFADYTELDYSDAFYGAGYTISSFPSLYDMYGKFMAGLDVCVLFGQVLDDVQHKPTIEAATVAHADLLNDDLEQVAIPRYEEGLRDINAVMTSSFVIGKSLIEQGRNKKLAEFDATLRYKLIPIATEVWTRHLNWNQNVISTYAEIMKLAISAKLDTDGRNYEFIAKDTMWPFTVLEQERANLGALQGAVSSSASEAGASTGQKVIGGALSGAAAGASVGSVVPGIGTAVGAIGGAVVGGLAGLF